MNKEIIRYSVLSLALTIVISSCEQSSSADMEVMTNETDSVSYALGVNIGESLKQQGAGDLNFETMLAAAERAYAGDTTLAMKGEDAAKYLNTFFQNKQREKAQMTLQEGQDFLEANKSNPDVIVMPSGLQYEILESGNGNTAVLGDSVYAHYTGMFIDGETFESSLQAGRPAGFKVGGVIRGMNEALLMMKEGDKWKLYIPAELGYGAMAGGRIPPNSALIFELELLTVKKN